MTYQYYGVMLASFIVFYFFTPARSTTWLFVIYVVIVASFFVGYRGFTAGSDTISYTSAYLQINTEQFDYLELSRVFVVNNVTAAEPGFVIYTYILKLLGFGLNEYFTIIAFTGLFILFSGYKRLTPFWALSVFLYLMSISFISLHANIIRQGIAVAFIILAISYLIERRLIPFFIFGTAALLFHISALPIMIMLVSTIFLRKHSFYWLGALLCVLLIISDIVPFLLSFIFSGIFISKMNTYFSGGLESVLTFKLWSVFIFYGMLMFMLQKTTNPEDKERIYRIGLIYICLFIPQLLFSGDHVASERFGFYRFTLEPIIISMLLTIIKPRFFASVCIAFLAGIYGVIVYNLPSVQYMLKV